MLLDTVLLSKPLILHEGFQVFNGKGRAKQHIITSLRDLRVGKVYFTEKGSSLWRRSETQLVIGDRIEIPVEQVSFPQVADDEDVPVKFALVMRGRLLPQTLCLALENFSRVKLSKGMLFFEEDKKLAHILHSLDELMPSKVYIRDSGMDRVELCLLPEGRIRFRFQTANQILTEFASSSASTDEKLFPMATFACGAASHVLNKLNSSCQPMAVNHTRHAAAAAAAAAARRAAAGSDSASSTPTTNEAAQFAASQAATHLSRLPRMRLDTHDAAAAVPYTAASTDPSSVMKKNVSNFDSVFFDSPNWIELVDTPKPVGPMSRRLAARTPPGPMVAERIRPVAALPPGSPMAIVPVTPPQPAPVSAAAPPAPPIHVAGAPPPPPPPLPPPLPGSRVAHAGKRTRPLHWDALPASAIGADSFWSEVGTPTKAGAEFSLDVGEVESLFAAASPAKKTKGDSSGASSSSSSSSSAPAPTSVSLLGLKKANNFGIVLTGLRIPPPVLTAALRDADGTVLTEDVLSGLASALDTLTVDDVGALEGYEGPLSRLSTGDRAAKALVESVPRVTERVQVLLFASRFRSTVNQVLSQLTALRSACTELRSSTRFQGLLRLVYSLGSVLNRSSYLAGARGFQLSSLSSLCSTRSRDGSSALDYVVGVVLGSTPRLADFPAEVPSMNAAQRLGLNELEREVAALREGLRLVTDELARPADVHADRFVAVVSAFAKSAAKDLESLAADARETRAAFDSLVGYFGGDPAATTTQAFFGSLADFVARFERSVTAARRTAARQAKGQSTATPLAEQRENMA